MNRLTKGRPFFAGALVLFGIIGAVFTNGRAASAQTPPAPAAGSMTVGAVLARLSREAKVAVVADASVDVRAPLPAGFAAAMPAALEARLEALVRAALPAGATWTRLYLPAPAPGAPTYEGNDVAALAAAQTKLFGATTGDAILLNGRRLSPKDAAPLLDSLNLKPVYLVTGAGARPVAGSGAGAETLAAWSQLTPAQRDQMAAGILNMNPALRNQMMQQMVSVFTNVLQKMSPDEIQQMLAGTPLNVGAAERLRAP